jgi:CRISPR-associated protein Cst2
VPYSAEVHATRYQYGFALTPDQLIEPNRAAAVVDAVVNLTEVAGNHARFFYDFAPDAIIFRWTDDAAPRVLYTFQIDADGNIAVPQLLRRIRAGDVGVSELIIGGSLMATVDGEMLHQLGATTFSGVKAAAEEVKRRMAQTAGQ